MVKNLEVGKGLGEDFSYPVAITKLLKKGHSILFVNKAFYEKFTNFEVIPRQTTLEKLFGDYFKDMSLISLKYLGTNFYILNFPLTKRKKLHIFLEEKVWFKFPHWFHTERLASLGKLAGEISHELNNPLGGILLYANMLKEELPAQSRWQDLVDKIIKLTIRCRVISRALLDFGKPERAKKEWINLNKPIMNIYELIKDYHIFKEIKFHFNLDTELPIFYANPTQMEQIFLNLFTNAAEAMKGKGEIFVETKASDDKIVIKVRDTGPGISEEVLPYIFDPFFTTKKTGKGTGLGLSICHSIIRRHGGEIRVSNHPMGGAIFEIVLSLPTREALREDVF
ncbi:MAG: sensor histidine kinase [Caldimicrobium sp.]